MKSLLTAVVLCLMTISSATAGTGKQSYGLPGTLPPGSKFFDRVYVEAVGMGAAVVATFQIPPMNPAE